MYDSKWLWVQMPITSPGWTPCSSSHSAHFTLFSVISAKVVSVPVTASTYIYVVGLQSNEQGLSGKLWQNLRWSLFHGISIIICSRNKVYPFTCATKSGLLRSFSNTNTPIFVHSLWIDTSLPIKTLFSILNVRVSCEHVCKIQWYMTMIIKLGI